jgi:ribosome-binding factor A
VVIKYLPKLLFRKDESFEYAEKIENLIKQTIKLGNENMNSKAK